MKFKCSVIFLLALATTTANNVAGETISVTTQPILTNYSVEGTSSNETSASDNTRPQNDGDINFTSDQPQIDEQSNETVSITTQIPQNFEQSNETVSITTDIPQNVEQSNETIGVTTQKPPNSEQFDGNISVTSQKSQNAGRSNETASVTPHPDLSSNREINSSNKPNASAKPPNAGQKRKSFNGLSLTEFGLPRSDKTTTVTSGTFSTSSPAKNTESAWVKALKVFGIIVLFVQLAIGFSLYRLRKRKNHNMLCTFKRRDGPLEEQLIPTYSD